MTIYQQLQHGCWAEARQVKHNKMKNIIFIIFAIIIFKCNNTFSQEDSNFASAKIQHLFTLFSGVSFHSLCDEKMSLLIYNGTPDGVEIISLTAAILMAIA